MSAGWGQFFALASAFTWALAVICLRRAGEGLPAFELNFFKNLVGIALVAVSLLVVGSTWPADYPAGDIALAMLSGFLGIAVADTWYLKALGMMGASRTGIVASLLSPFVIFLSVLFLGERLSYWQIVGFVLVMMGILLVTWRTQRHERESEQVRLGLLYGVGGVFLMAVGVVMAKEILERRDFMWTVEIRLVGGTLGMFVYALLRGQLGSLRRAFHRDLPWGWIIAGSTLGAYVSMMMWLAGYKLIPASEASILNETASAWIVLLAWLILRERLEPRRVVGLALTFGGVAVMLTQ